MSKDYSNKKILSSEEEKTPEVEVFRIHHKDIPQGRTQCVKHAWKKLNDNELYCPICESAIIVNPEVLNELI